MKIVAKITRVLTIAPIAATILNLTLYFLYPDQFNHWYELLLIILFTAILPVFAYPIQKLFKIIKMDDQRKASRKLAIILSLSSYSIGLIYCLFAKLSDLQTLIYLTYFFSGLTMFVLNLVLHIKASGHMCGVNGPVSVIIYFLGLFYLPLILIPIFVGWSSLKLKRHEMQELMIGFIIPVIAMLISMLLIYVF